MRLWINSALATIFTFLMLGALSAILNLQAFQAFDPIGQAIGDIELTDIAFSKIREGEQLPDPNITIVNIGNLTRGEIGDQLRNIIRYKPKVIGLDVIFSNPPEDSLNNTDATDFRSNFSLYSALREAELAGIKIVMAEKVMQTRKLLETEGDIAKWDSIVHADAQILLNSAEGFVNLDSDADGQEDIKVSRKMNPTIEVNGKTELAFSVKIAMMFDSLRAKKFLDRGNETEVINFRGNTPDFYFASSYSGSRYQFLEYFQALDSNLFDGSMIKDKIVILGFHGKDLKDKTWEDKFFTPLNENYAGKSRPDMYGSVVHANIVSMILNEDYIDRVPSWISELITIIIMFFVIALFFKIETHLPVWYDLLSLLVQLILFLFFSFVAIYIFSKYNIMIDFTPTLAAAAVIGTCFEIYCGILLRIYDQFLERMNKNKEKAQKPD
jgi:CHASE2 domain-containing sensor protein